MVGPAERRVASMNGTMSRRLTATIPTRKSPGVFSTPIATADQHEKRVNTTERSIPYPRLPCILALRRTRKQGRKSLPLAQRASERHRNTAWTDAVLLIDEIRVP